MTERHVAILGDVHVEEIRDPGGIRESVTGDAAELARSLRGHGLRLTVIAPVGDDSDGEWINAVLHASGVQLIAVAAPAGTPRRAIVRDRNGTVSERAHGETAFTDTRRSLAAQATADVIVDLRGPRRATLEEDRDEVLRALGLFGVASGAGSEAERSAEPGVELSADAEPASEVKPEAEAEPAAAAEPEAVAMAVVVAAPGPGDEAGSAPEPGDESGSASEPEVEPKPESAVAPESESVVEPAAEREPELERESESAAPKSEPEPEPEPEPATGDEDPLSAEVPGIADAIGSTSARLLPAPIVAGTISHGPVRLLPPAPVAHAPAEDWYGLDAEIARIAT